MRKKRLLGGLAIVAGIVAGATAIPTAASAGNPDYCDQAWVCIYRDSWWGAGLGARSADPVYLGNDQQLPFSPITAMVGIEEMVFRYRVNIILKGLCFISISEFKLCIGDAVPWLDVCTMDM